MGGRKTDGGGHTGATHRPRKTTGGQAAASPPCATCTCLPPHLFLSASPPASHLFLSTSPPASPPVPACPEDRRPEGGNHADASTAAARLPTRTCTCTSLPARLSHARTSAAGGAFACSSPSALPARSFDSAGSLLSGTMARRGTLDAEHLPISRHIAPYLESHGLARHPYLPYLHTAGWASSRPRRTRGTCCTSRSSWSP